MKLFQLATPGPSSRIDGVLGRATQGVAGLLFAALLVLNLVQVGLRSFTSGLIWVTDLSQLLLLWMVMMGTVAAYCYNEHIVTGYLDGKLRGTALKVLLVVLRVLEASFFLILITAGYAVTLVRGNIPYVQLGVSTGWTYAAIPVAGVLLLIAAAVRPLSVPVPGGNTDLELPEGPDEQRK